MSDEDLIKPQLANRTMQSGTGDSETIYHGQLLNLHCAPILREPEEQQHQQDLERLEMEKKVKHIADLHQLADKE